MFSALDPWFSVGLPQQMTQVTRPGRNCTPGPPSCLGPQPRCRPNRAPGAPWGKVRVTNWGSHWCYQMLSLVSKKLTRLKPNCMAVGHIVFPNKSNKSILFEKVEVMLDRCEIISKCLWNRMISSGLPHRDAFAPSRTCRRLADWASQLPRFEGLDGVGIHSLRRLNSKDVCLMFVFWRSLVPFLGFSHLAKQSVTYWKGLLWDKVLKVVFLTLGVPYGEMAPGDVTTAQTE